jgi:hypothetical protein
MLNTHYYDDKLSVLIATVKTHIDEASLVSDETKRRCAEAIREKLSATATKYLDLILSAWGTSANRDERNHLSAENLLWLCHRDMSDDLLAILDIQLCDIATGTCNVGRTTRLFQTWVMCSTRVV